MKIAEIEAIPLRVPYEERIRKRYYHFAMTELVTVYKFYTDTGLIGSERTQGRRLIRTCWMPISARIRSTTSWVRVVLTLIWRATI